MGPVGEPHAALLAGRDDGDAQLLGLDHHVRPEALLVHDDEVGHPGAYEPELPRDGPYDLRAFVVSAHVVGSAAEAPDLDVAEEVVVHEVVDDVDAREHVVPDAHYHRLSGIYGPVADLCQGGLRLALGQAEGGHLHDVGDLQRDVVEHPGVEGLRLEVDVVPLLTGVGCGHQLDDLRLDVVEGVLQVSEGLWLDAADKTHVGSLDNRVQGDIEGHIPPVFVHEVIQHVPCVGGVGGRPDAAGDEDNPRLLAGHRYSAGPPLISRQIAFPEGAETTEIAEGHVEGLVPI